jgi:hypothetical protein
VCELQSIIFGLCSSLRACTTVPTVLPLSMNYVPWEIGGRRRPNIAQLRLFHPLHTFPPQVKWPIPLPFAS